MDKKEVLYRMMLIREMEHKIESLFSQGMLRGTHTAVLVRSPFRLR